MGNIIQIEIKRDDTESWLDEVSKKETHFYTAIAVIAKNCEAAEQIVGEIKKREGLNLRKAGYELAGRTEVSEKEIKGTVYVVKKYAFRWTAWKWLVMNQAHLMIINVPKDMSTDNPNYRKPQVVIRMS